MSGSLVFKLGKRRAGADQVAVSTGAVDAAYRREVLVLLEVVDRESGLLTRVLPGPVGGNDGGRGVRCVAQRAVLHGEVTGSDLVDFLADGDHRVDETVNLHQVLGLG